jgi:hypothetical protein
MRYLVGFLAVVLAVLAWPRLMPPPAQPGAGRVVEGLPWQIEVLPDGGSRVFGLELGKSTLGESIARLGSHGELAIVAAPGEAGSLELYFDNVTLGAVMGRLVLTGSVGKEALEAMRGRAKKSAYMQSSTRKATLADADVAAARAAPVAALAFIPAIHLDEALILQRFGPPAERLRSSAQTEHFLYPDRGLDIVMDAKGKELLQYVAPRDFEARLRAPLRQAQAAGG